LYLFNNKIGTGLAILFNAWALALEQAGDTRKADRAYVRGIELQAQPVEWLQAQHRYDVVLAIVLIYLHVCICS